MKALITGGAGFIGFHLAKHLASQNCDVTILDNFARGADDAEFRALLERKNVSFVKADLTDPHCTDGLDRDYDQVYHLAMINGTENFYNIPHKVLKVGILGTLHILDWFVQLGKGKFVFSSSSETYAGAVRLLGEKFPIPTPEEVPLVVDNPRNVRWSYGASKILSEVAIHSYAKAFDMKRFAIVRYHNIYGPRMGNEHVIPQFIERIVKREEPFKIFGGQETRTFCYVDDAVRATQLVMERSETDGATIHIGRSDEELKMVDLAKMLFDAAGYQPKFDVQPAPEGSVMRRCPDITKLRKLGFAPQVALKEGVERTFAWYKEAYAR